MDLIVLRRHEGVHPVRYIQEPGATIPAYATAVGKALLARRPSMSWWRGCRSGSSPTRAMST